MNVYEQIINQKINKKAQKDISNDISSVINEPDDISIEIIKILLSYACTPTHIAPITYARDLLLQIQTDWISNKIKDLVFESINIYDDWDYRRFLELSKMISDELLDWAISISNNSQNPDVIEAAEDFKKI